ncbi:MAG: 4Fe-4S dicluster domain-containing protein [Campylobacteraceae bacterium]|nr:4Fe-4S dicluster domain-containing protein [Campylobacteraceae bacterium]
MINESRRVFFKRAGLVGSALLLTPKGAKATQDLNSRIGSLIDLSKCDGCAHISTPACVEACRDKNQIYFPEPKHPIQPYWPRKQFEDWSSERERIDRLTPYNWTFVEKVQVDGETVYIPRRCMHCDNPSCLNLCPFGTIGKTKTGAVYIDPEFCMGGAKCRDACPWGIPQRQAGVGIYLKLAPKLAGGGVMYKCDGCADLQAKGETPVCQTSCPKDAITFGPYEKIKSLAKNRAKEINGYLYGLGEGGGTGTIYVSSIPFEKINKAIMVDKKEGNDKRPGRPHISPNTPDKMEDATTWMVASLVAPFAGIAAAAISVYRSSKGDNDEKSN